MMVGDRPETDGDFAAELGVDFGLVRSGVTPPGRDVEPPPASTRPTSPRSSTATSLARVDRLSSAARRPCRGAARVIVCGRDARRLLQMTSNDLIKRLIDAGLSFTQMTQAKAEEIVKDLQEPGSSGSTRRRPPCRS